MKIFRFLFIVYIILFVGSCRSVRKVVATDQSELNISSDLALDSFHTDSSRYETCDVDKLIQRNFELEIIEWSTPDSLGKQYKVKTIKAVDKSVEQESTTSTIKDSVVSKHSSFSESYKESQARQKTKESKTSIDYTHLVIGGIIVLVVIIVIILYKLRAKSLII